MHNRQFVACAFKAGGRPYTYQNDGEPVAIGDFVRVAGRNGAEQRVEVVEILPEPPPFECKSIIGRADPINSSEEEHHA